MNLKKAVNQVFLNKLEENHFKIPLMNVEAPPKVVSFESFLREIQNSNSNLKDFDSSEDQELSKKAMDLRENHF